MNKIDFKKVWCLDEYDSWSEFQTELLENTRLGNMTKDFLKNGFPYDAAPGLNFGSPNDDSILSTIYTCYSDNDLVSGTENYWIFGSDSSGNPICIDSSSNDKILLLNHELGFEPIQNINSNVIELAECLLLYKNFIDDIQEELGEDAFFDSEFNKHHIDNLCQKFEKVNPNILNESDFWESEIQLLYEEIA